MPKPCQDCGKPQNAKEAELTAWPHGSPRDVCGDCYHKHGRPRSPCDLCYGPRLLRESKPSRKLQGRSVRTCWPCAREGGLLEVLRYSLASNRYFGLRLRVGEDSPLAESGEVHILRDRRRRRVTREGTYPLSCQARVAEASLYERPDPDDDRCSRKADYVMPDGGLYCWQHERTISHQDGHRLDSEKGERILAETRGIAPPGKKPTID